MVLDLSGFIKSLSSKHFNINKQKLYNYLFDGYKTMYKDKNTFLKYYLLENATF